MPSAAKRVRDTIKAGIMAKRALRAASPFTGPTVKAITAAESARALILAHARRRMGWEYELIEGRHDKRGGEYVALLKGDRGTTVMLLATCAGNLVTSAGDPITVPDAIRAVRFK